jgi:ferredoxin
MGRPAFLYHLMMRFYKPFQWFEGLRPVRVRSSDATSSSHIVPVNESVSSGGAIVLPMKIVAAFVERADGIAILDECLCRRGNGCSSYPIDMGCLLLGPAVRDLHKGLGRIVGPDEALEYAARAIRTGLTPLVVHNSFDAWLWGIDYGRMMNICFCCDCCCSVRRGVRLGIDSGASLTMHRLPGLSLSVNERCDGCGACMAACFAGAIRVSRGTISIDQDLCKGCGRCMDACPKDAITMTLDSATDPVGRLVTLYGKRSNVGILGRSHKAKREKPA